MSTVIYRTILIIVFILVVSGLSCATKKNEAVKTQKKETTKAITLADLPQPVRTSVEKLTVGGMIKKIETDTEDAQLIYDIEVNVKGKDLEYGVGADGSILTAEESIEYSTMPKAVCSAAEQYFGSAEGLKAHKEIDKGINYYEVEGVKNGKPVALKLSEIGEIVEEENQE